MLTFQQIILRLQNYWDQQGCALLQPYDMEVGAGTFHTATFLRSIGPEPWRAAYVQPSRRPKDGRYGENPNRLQHYYQYQVVLKPAPPNILDLYLGSLHARHRPAAATTSASSRTTGNRRPSAPGAWAGKSGSTAWRSPSSPTSRRWVSLNASRSPAKSPTAWSGWRCTCRASRASTTCCGRRASRYGDVFHQNEVEQSTYNFEQSDAAMLFAHFDDYEREAQRLIEAQLALPAYEMVMKCSHRFNLLDARGAISVTERAAYIGRVRTLARAVAQAYYDSRERLGFPMLPAAPRAAPGQPMNPPLLVELFTEELPPRALERLAKPLPRPWSGSCARRARWRRTVPRRRCIARRAAWRVASDVLQTAPDASAAEGPSVASASIRGAARRGAARNGPRSRAWRSTR